MTLKQNRPWTEDDDRRLLELVETKGKTRRLVAAALKRSVIAIAGRLKILRAQKGKPALSNAGEL